MDGSEDRVNELRRTPIKAVGLGHASQKELEPDTGTQVGQVLDDG